MAALRCSVIDRFLSRCRATQEIPGLFNFCPFAREMSDSMLGQIACTCSPALLLAATATTERVDTLHVRNMCPTLIAMKKDRTGLINDSDVYFSIIRNMIFMGPIFDEDTERQYSKFCFGSVT
jgi:hypothetical protein